MRTPLPGTTNSGYMKLSGASVVSRTMRRRHSVRRRRRGRVSGKDMPQCSPVQAGENKAPPLARNPDRVPNLPRWAAAAEPQPEVQGDVPDVRQGEDQGRRKSPVYQFLTAKHGEPKWNFHKYLVGKDGQVLAAFPAKMSPEDPSIDDGDRRGAEEAAITAWGGREEFSACHPPDSPAARRRSSSARTTSSMRGVRATIGFRPRAWAAAAVVGPMTTSAWPRQRADAVAGHERLQGRGAGEGGDVERGQRRQVGQGHGLRGGHHVHRAAAGPQRAGQRVAAADRLGEQAARARRADRRTRRSARPGADRRGRGPRRSRAAPGPARSRHPRPPRCGRGQGRRVDRGRQPARRRSGRRWRW